MRAKKIGVVEIKRAYEPAAPSDGQRVLVDRLWPRGVSKGRLAIETWEKDVAPSDGLRRWFHHEAPRWSEFERRYRDELGTPAASEALLRLAERARRGKLTLVYGARDEAHNDAVVLRAEIERRLGSASPRPKTRARLRASPRRARRAAPGTRSAR